MADVMEFPNTWEEYEKIYGFNDIDQVYTNGSRLIPSFRVKQWLDHIADRPEGEWIEGKYDLMCSNCENTQEYEKFPYCPYCGASMREREGE